MRNALRSRLDNFNMRRAFLAALQDGVPCAKNEMDSEYAPLYRAQRIAAEEAIKQEMDNLFRRLTFRPILKTSRQAEAECLARYGLGPEAATWKRRYS